VAAQLTQKVLGAAGDKFKDFFEDPNKMLQMILAAESMRSSGGGGGGGMGGPGHGSGGAGGIRTWQRWGFSGGAGGSGGSGSGGPAVAPACGILARQAAVAKELARVGPVWEVAPDPDPVGGGGGVAGLAREVGVELVAVVLEV